MRAPLLTGCVAALVAATSARAEVTKFFEGPPQPYAEQDKASDAYVRVPLEVEGAFDGREGSFAMLDKALIGKDGRVKYEVQATLLRPAKQKPRGATLLVVETEAESGAGADLLEPTRRRQGAVLFLSSDFDAAPEPLRGAVLRDLLFHMRKAMRAAPVVGRGSGRKAEFLQNVARPPGAEEKSRVAVFDALLLHDRTISAPSATAPKALSLSKSPFTIETFGSSVYWRSDVKFAGRDLAAQDDKRRRVFFLAGMPGRNGAKTENCSAPVNSRSIAPALRALFVALVDWASKGIVPPASRIPQETNRTLVALRDLRWPKIPKLKAPSGDDGPDHAEFRRNRLNAEGVIGSNSIERAQREKPVHTFSHRALVPAIDADGNEVAGLRLPDHAVAIGTFTGWNGRKEKEGPPCEAYGAYLPFASAKAERDKNGDPRLSLQERFGLRDFYVATVRTIADKLVKERLLLKPDADAYVAAAKKAPF
jgi:hypothetical protein